jgi:hypothetical protein
MRAKRPMMVSRVEEGDPGSGGGDSAGPDVLFMAAACVRLDEVPGYQKRVRCRSEQKQQSCFEDKLQLEGGSLSIQVRCGAKRMKGMVGVHNTYI